MEWYETRASDTVTGFLAMDGITLIRYPTFGRVKVRRLIEIVSSALGVQCDADHLLNETELDNEISSSNSASNVVVAPTVRPAKESLEILEIPADLPLELVRLPVRILHYCKDHHIRTLGEFLDTWESLGESYFISVPNLGRKSVGEGQSLWIAICQGDIEGVKRWLPVDRSGRGLSLVEGLLDAVQSLPSHHRILLENRLVHGQTLEDSSTEFGITRERTRQVESQLLEQVANLLDWFPRIRDDVQARWMKGETFMDRLGGEVSAADHDLIEASIRRVFTDRPEGAARELELESLMERWHEKLKKHPDLLVEGVDLEDFMQAEVPPEHRETFCLSLDGKGRIRLDHTTGRVVHTGPRLREVVKAILAREDDPIPLTWLHELVRQTPTHAHVEREQIYRYRIQWKSDDPDFPRDKVLWLQ